MNYIEYIIEHQCEAIGIPRDAISPYGKESTWYSDFSWTKECEDGFVDWLANELYTNTGMRKALMFCPRKTKRDTIDVAKSWCFMYGWRVEE